MYFNLDELPIEIIKSKKEYYRRQLVFTYNGQKYYYKEMITYEYYYNEVIAEKIAKQAGIPCAHYYLGCFAGRDGIISEEIQLEHYQSMQAFLDNHRTRHRKIRNTFENIWEALDNEFDEATTARLMDKLVDIFLFDAIIGNPDRNLENYGLIIEEDSTQFAPLIDNEFMTYDKTIKDGYYDLRFDKISERQNMLYYFLDISDKTYHERLLKLLPLISKKNLQRIFFELERDGITIPIDIRLKLLKKFAINREMIENYFTEKPKTYQKAK